MDLMCLLGWCWQTWSTRRCFRPPWAVGQVVNLVFRGYFCLEDAGKDRGEAQGPNKQENAPAGWCSRELGLHSSQLTFLEWEYMKFQQDFPGIPRMWSRVSAGDVGDGGDHEESKGCSIKNT